MNSKKVLIHLGYPKVGSTSLQTFLDKIRDKNFTFFSTKFREGPYCNYLNKTFLEIEKQIFFEENDNLKKDWIKYFEINLNHINVISNELFLYPINYRFVNFQRTLKRYLDILTYLDCEIELLIMIRDPKELHISFFTDMYHRFIQYDNSLISFKEYILSIEKNKVTKHIFETFNFNKIICLVEEIDDRLLINKNFHILRLEKINDFKNFFFNFCKNFNLRNEFNFLNIQKKHVTKKDKDIYIRDYDATAFFIKHDPNNQIKYAIKKTLKLSKIFNYFLGFKKIKNSYTKEMSDKLNSYYKKDLKKLEQKINVNLKNYYE